jgi:hypothetical protein
MRAWSGTYSALYVTAASGLAMIGRHCWRASLGTWRLQQAGLLERIAYDVPRFQRHGAETLLGETRERVILRLVEVEPDSFHRITPETSGP